MRIASAAEVSDTRWVGYTFTLFDLPEDVATIRSAAYAEMSLEALGRYHEAIRPYVLAMNLAGIGFCRSQMTSLGMVCEGSPSPFPSYPDLDYAACDSEQDDRLVRPEMWKEYDDAEFRASAQRGQGPGIARFKFETNGPWLVVAAEVEEALLIYDSTPSRVRTELEADEFWCAWIAWLRRAQGGFWVD